MARHPLSPADPRTALAACGLVLAVACMSSALLPLLAAVAPLLAAHLLLLRLQVPHPTLYAVLAALPPSILLLAGSAGPYDMLAAAACLMAMLAAIDRRHATMLAWAGIGCGCATQTLFIAPFLLAVLIHRRVPLHLWAIAPLAGGATLLLGWTLEIRPETVPILTATAPNLWAIVDALPLGGVALVGLAFAAAIGVGGAYVAHLTTGPLEPRMLVPAALLSALIMIGLLPHRHLGDLYLVDLLGMIVAFASGSQTNWRVALLIQAGSCLAVLGSVTPVSGLTMIGAVAILAATVTLARAVLRPAANDNAPFLPRLARSGLS